MPLVQYSECRNGAQTRQTGFTILYLYPSVTVRCLRDSLSVTDSGTVAETPFEAPLWTFAWHKFTQNYLQWNLKENGMLKILAGYHSGAPFQPGALRTCVPCLMVNPALKVRRCAVIFSFMYAIRLATAAYWCQISQRAFLIIFCAHMPVCDISKTWQNFYNAMIMLNVDIVINEHFSAR